MIRKIRVKAIVITRQGGPIQSFYDVMLGNWAEADAILKLWAKTAPNTGYYDNCEFRVIFEDGYLYSGSYHLKQHDTFLKDLLPRHILKVCNETRIGWDADEFLDKYDVPNVA
ncbi:MAG TPA: hypothetical protein VFG19_13745 [Geobacteraceae bacterium]|nr:hypothetical protein [Geobacteraceae bacterium]